MNYTRPYTLTTLALSYFPQTRYHAFVRTSYTLVVYPQSNELSSATFLFHIPEGEHPCGCGARPYMPLQPRQCLFQAHVHF